MQCGGRTRFVDDNSLPVRVITCGVDGEDGGASGDLPGGRRRVCADVAAEGANIEMRIGPHARLVVVAGRRRPVILESRRRCRRGGLGLQVVMARGPVDPVFTVCSVCRPLSRAGVPFRYRPSACSGRGAASHGGAPERRGEHDVVLAQVLRPERLDASGRQKARTGKVLRARKRGLGQTRRRSKSYHLVVALRARLALPASGDILTVEFDGYSGSTIRLDSQPYLRPE